MPRRKAIGVHGFVLGALHATLAIATLSPATYGKLYDAAGRLTFEGGLAVLGGVLTFAALIVPAVTSMSLVRKSMTGEAWKRAQRLGLVALALGIAHVGVLGWRSWLAPSTWIGGLPPLTLIAVSAGVLSLVFRGAALAQVRRASAASNNTPPRIEITVDAVTSRLFSVLR
jgi:DMSO/TMAO reductase YedYZ heme-binding membrane subunit